MRDDACQQAFEAYANSLGTKLNLTTNEPAHPEIYVDGETAVSFADYQAGWHAALVHLAAFGKGEYANLIDIDLLRRELLQSKMTHTFTFSRDELMQLLGGQFKILESLIEKGDA